MGKFNIIIVDDHTLFRKGLIAALSSSPLIDQIFEAGDGRQFLELLPACNAKVVLMDISMPVMDGMEATRIAVSRYPEIKIIALSMYNDIGHFEEMINAGVVGFLHKDAVLEDVNKAIISVAEGNKFFSQELMYNLLKKINTDRAYSDLLSGREKEILKLVSSGKSNQEIADILHISKRTVDKHRENILLKTHTKNTAELIMFAIKNKLI